MLHEKTPLRRKTEQVIIRWATGACALVARALPMRWLRALGNAVGWVIYHALRTRRELAMDNLRRVLGDRLDDRERARVVLASVRNMTKTMLELLKLPAISAERLERLVPVSGEENLREAVEGGRGVIVVTPHFGNWELLAARARQMGYRLSVVARDANDPATAGIITHARETFGTRVLERDELRTMLRTLADGEVLGILPDQHGGEAGVWLDFMGRPASTVTGPAALAVRTGAAVVPGFGLRTEDEDVHVRFLPALEIPDTGDRDEDVRRLTQRINDVLGEQIMRHPEQWLWMHNRWRTPPQDLDAAESARG